MIETRTMAWIAAGLLAGFLHATMLRRATHRLTVWTPALGMLRLGLVATVLVVAALAGEILAAAGGWAVGFVTVSARLATRRTDRTPASTSAPTGEQRNLPHAS